MATLVLFDLDGTLTKKDTLSDFLKYFIGKSRYYRGILFLSPILLAYKLRLIPNYKAKEKLTTFFLKGVDVNKFQQIADDYSKEKLDKIIKSSAFNRMRWHQEKGHKIVVVSASIECWLRGWCKKYNLDLVGTQLESKDSKLTGKFSTRNCYGIEKVNRIKERYNLNDYEVIYAYGNSKGDKEMLNIADKRYYRYF